MRTNCMFKPAALATILGMSAILSAGSLHADDAPESMNQDAISLVQAVKIAKQHTGAEPLEAERDVEMGQAIYEIELTKKGANKSTSPSVNP